MDIIEELTKCKSTITQARETIGKLMLSLAKIYGGEIESPAGRTYSGVEAATGIPCQIKSFSENESLMANASFDGDDYELPISNFYAEELVEVMQSMIKERKDALLAKANKAYADYKNRTKQEPHYLKCQITYKDDGSQLDVIIKLSLDVVESEDDKIFFNFNSYDDLKYFVDIGKEDFIVTKFYHLEEYLD